MPTDAPLNYAEAVDFNDGKLRSQMLKLVDAGCRQQRGMGSILGRPLDVKFGILNRDGPNPEVYSINSNTHTVHPAFWA